MEKKVTTAFCYSLATRRLCGNRCGAIVRTFSTVRCAKCVAVCKGGLQCNEDLTPSLDENAARLYAKKTNSAYYKTTGKLNRPIRLSISQRQLYFGGVQLCLQFLILIVSLHGRYGSSHAVVWLDSYNK